MRTLVIAPHPDDELLGCGGTLLRRSREGHTIGWLLMTCITEQGGGSRARVEARAREIDKVREGLGITPENLFQLDLPTTALDQVPLGVLVKRISDVFTTFQPEDVFLPHPGDAHSDHRITFEATSACTKWFRYPSIRRVLTYETLSETDAGLDSSRPFQPTTYVDIGDYLDQKIGLLELYASEMGAFPFPRSTEALKALAQLRGAQAGFSACEAFQLLRERV